MSSYAPASLWTCFPKCALLVVVSLSVWKVNNYRHQDLKHIDVFPRIQLQMSNETNPVGPDQVMLEKLMDEILRLKAKLGSDD